MRKTVGILVILTLLAFGGSRAFANQTEWRDNAYNFSGIKTILIMEPKFTYNNPDNEYNRFEKYPNGRENLRTRINAQFTKMPNIRYVDINYVIDQVRADPNVATDLDFNSPGVWPLIKRELPKHVDAVLFSEVRNYGWYYEYYPPYDTEETKIEKVRYSGVTPEGKHFHGWMEVPRTVIVHHDAGYKIYDSAEVHFGLVDTKSGKHFWKYSDVRTRNSFSWNKEYDSSGPESMMNRIFDRLAEKLPIH